MQGDRETKIRHAKATLSLFSTGPPFPYMLTPNGKLQLLLTRGTRNISDNYVFEYRAFPYVHSGGGRPDDTVNSLYRGWLESETALFLGSSTHRDKEFGILVLNGTADWARSVSWRLDTWGIYETVNVQACYQIDTNPAVITMLLLNCADAHCLCELCSDFVKLYDKVEADTSWIGKTFPLRFPLAKIVTKLEELNSLEEEMQCL